MKKRLCFLLMTFCLVLMGRMSHGVYAQNPQTIEVGPHFGVSSYIGELNVWRNLPNWKWNELNQFGYDWGILARYNYDSRWSFRLDYTHGMVRACDTTAAWRPEAMLNFKSTINDLSLIVEFNFLDYYTGHVSDVISPYIFAGISGFMCDTRPFTRDTILAPIIDNKSLSFRKLSAMSIPFGVGCKMSFTKRLAATVEWRMHYTFTDDLDDVSDVYPAGDNHALLVSAYKTDENGNIYYSQGKPIIIYEVVEGNPEEIQNVLYDISDPTFNSKPSDPSCQFHESQQRGNLQTNDWFGFINFSLTWKFVIPNRSSCKMYSY